MIKTNNFLCSKLIYTIIRAEKKARSGWTTICFMACYEDKTRPGGELLIIIFNILISYLRPVLVLTFISKIIWKCRRGPQVASDGTDNDLIKLLRTAKILGALISCLHDNSDQNSWLAPILNFKASWTCLVLDLWPQWSPVHLMLVLVSSIFYRGATQP